MGCSPLEDVPGVLQGVHRASLHNACRRYSLTPSQIITFAEPPGLPVALSCNELRSPGTIADEMSSVLTSPSLSPLALNFLPLTRTSTVATPGAPLVIVTLSSARGTSVMLSVSDWPLSRTASTRIGSQILTL